jgi:hypothetical protein
MWGLRRYGLSIMSASPYDLSVLQERATQWRAEAAAARFEAMRQFCLSEADRCERQVHKSLSTPVLRESLDRWGSGSHAG